MKRGPWRQRLPAKSSMQAASVKPEDPSSKHQEAASAKRQAKKYFRKFVEPQSMNQQA